VGNADIAQHFQILGRVTVDLGVSALLASLLLQELEIDDHGANARANGAPYQAGLAREEYRFHDQSP
jgi:hypothetical protein